MKNYEDLNFKVCKSLKYYFKLAAVRKGYKLKELLEEAFDMWLRMNDIDTWQQYNKEKLK